MVYFAPSVQGTAVVGAEAGCIELPQWLGSQIFDIFYVNTTTITMVHIARAVFRKYTVEVLDGILDGHYNKESMDRPAPTGLFLNQNGSQFQAIEKWFCQIQGGVLEQRQCLEEWHSH